jgi:hypothetical protein
MLSLIRFKRKSTSAHQEIKMNEFNEANLDSHRLIYSLFLSGEKKIREDHLFEIHCIRLIVDQILLDFHPMNDVMKYFHHQLNHQNSIEEQFLM